ncbi:hypothetical protein RCIP0092_00063 [Klebsiella phage RCIP0092]|jgi:hypothetical protein
MKLRCTDSNTINYTPGFEYSAELGVTVRTPHGSIGCDVVHGNNTWFFSTNQPSTPNAVTVRSWQPLR